MRDDPPSAVLDGVAGRDKIAKDIASREGVGPVNAEGVWTTKGYKNLDPIRAPQAILHATLSPFPPPPGIAAFV